MPKVDRSDIFSGIMAKAWARLGVWERLSMVHSVFGFISLWIVPDLLLDKIGMGKNKTPNSTPKQVAKNIWQIEYWGYVNATVIKGKDGTLLLHSAPVLQQRTVEELAKLGPVGAIVIPNLAHDEFAHVWKEKFPEAKVYCPEALVEEMGKGVSVEGSIEKSMDALENYGFKSCMNCQSWCAFDDCFLKVETETIEGKSATALISCCGVGNAPRSIFKPIEFFYGFLGLRIFRQFALVFTKDLKAARDFVNKMASIPEIDFVLFQHGQPLRGEAANAHLKNVYISRSFFSY